MLARVHDENIINRRRCRDLGRMLRSDRTRVLELVRAMAFLLPRLLPLLLHRRIGPLGAVESKVHTIRVEWEN